MPKLFRLLLSCLLIAAVSVKSPAQNSAFLNLGKLLADMPDTKQADMEIFLFRKQLVKKVEELKNECSVMSKNLETIDYAEDVKQRVKRQIEMKQQTIQEYEQGKERWLADKREQLLKPVLDKIDLVIQQVAGENGLVAVFDESVFNAVLYADVGYNVEPLVRSRLKKPVQNPVSFSARKAAMAFINTEEIMAALPDVKIVEAKLNVFQELLQKGWQDKNSILQKDFKALQQIEDQGRLIPSERKKLQDRENQLTQEAEKLQTQVEQTRNRELEPIYNKINNAITAVAKQYNLHFVFDKGVLLHADEKFDLTQQVIKQLGLTGSGTFQGGEAPFGFINSNALLAELPDIKKADNELVAFREQLVKKGQGMSNQLQQDQTVFQQKWERRELSPRQLGEERKKLSEMQEQLSKFEAQASVQLEEKRNSQLKPIYDKVNAAIKNTALEMGLSLVFEKSVLLNANLSLDISGQVKKKLGL